MNTYIIHNEHTCTCIRCVSTYIYILFGVYQYIQTEREIYMGALQTSDGGKPENPTSGKGVIEPRSGGCFRDQTRSIAADRRRR